MPRDPTPERATVLATLAQLKMLDGIFTESERLARGGDPGRAVACDPVPRAQEIHATTSLAVSRSRGDAIPIERSNFCARRSRAARELDDPDALFRIRANLTTVLDLVGRRAEAVEVAYAGIEDAKRARGSRPCTATSWRATLSSPSTTSVAGRRPETSASGR